MDREVTALREEYKLEQDVHDPLLVSPANLEASLIVDPLREVAHNAQALGSVKGLTNKNKEVLLRKEPYVLRSYENVFFGFGTRQKARSPRCGLLLC